RHVVQELRFGAAMLTVLAHARSLRFPSQPKSGLPDFGRLRLPNSGKPEFGCEPLRAVGRGEGWGARRIRCSTKAVAPRGFRTTHDPPPPDPPPPPFARGEGSTRGAATLNRHSHRAASLRVL